MKPGSYWVDGENLYYVDANSVIQNNIGILVNTPTGAIAGSVWLDTSDNSIHYISASVKHYTLPYLTISTGISGTAGSLWVEGVYLSFLDNVNAKRQWHNDAQPHADTGNSHSDGGAHTDAGTHSDAAVHSDASNHSDSASPHSDGTTHSDTPGHSDAQTPAYNDGSAPYSFLSHSDGTTHSDGASGHSDNPSAHSDICFHEETIVQTPNGPLALRYVMPGTELIGYDLLRKRASPVIVSAAVSDEKHGYVEIKVGTSKFKVTPEHPLYTNIGWMQAKDCLGVLLIGAKGAHVRVKSVVYYEAHLKVRSISTSPFHNFTVGDKFFIVHNLSATHGDSIVHSDALTGHADNSSAHSDGSVHHDGVAHSDVAGSHSDGGTHSDGSGHSDTPSSHSDNPSVHSDTPSAHSDTPGHSDGPGHSDAVGHADNVSHADWPAAP